MCFYKKTMLHCVLMSLNLLNLLPCLPGKMLNNNPQIHSAGRDDFRKVCPQRNGLKMTAHESTLQRGEGGEARERGGRERESYVSIHLSGGFSVNV